MSHGRVSHGRMSDGRFSESVMLYVDLGDSGEALDEMCFHVHLAWHPMARYTAAPDGSDVISVTHQGVKVDTDVALDDLADARAISREEAYDLILQLAWDRH